ncbi:MAG: hypothetical protein AB1522_13835 [Chloroflexota bacterium]
MTTAKGGTGKTALLAYGYRLGLLEDLTGRILLGLDNALTL